MSKTISSTELPDYRGVFTRLPLRASSNTIKSFPSVEMTVSNLILETMYQLNNFDFIKKYALESFPLKVQTIERTFADKVFAICDYYLNKDSFERSRHIYDLYKIYPIIKNDSALKELIRDTRIARMLSPFCKSASPNININETLYRIGKEDFFKHDYEMITEKLLYENVSYKNG